MTDDKRQAIRTMLNKEAADKDVPYGSEMWDDPNVREVFQKHLPKGRTKGKVVPMKKEKPAPGEKPVSKSTPKPVSKSTAKPVSKSTPKSTAKPPKGIVPMKKEKGYPALQKGAGDRKAHIRSMLFKEAGEKCGENGHYCETCDKYGEGTTCECGESCGCDMKKEASIRDAIRKVAYPGEQMVESIGKPIVDAGGELMDSIGRNVNERGAVAGMMGAGLGPTLVYLLKTNPKLSDYLMAAGGGAMAGMGATAAAGAANPDSPTV